jgi:DNA repair exonuclease SbcCD nuclease subunit
MSSFRFIHCSDLHIDSLFKGLRSAEPELAKRLRASTYQAFQNIVDLAITEKVDAVVIAGDIYDGADKSLQAQFKFLSALQKLSDAGIPSFLAHGNHDPLDSRFATLKWPDRVTVFSGKEVECHTLQRDGKPLARIHGISYSTRDVKKNLSLQFKRQSDDGFAIGVLHTNVGGNPDHGDYAPCSIDDLVAGRMDYWALGHIHRYQVLRESDPAIVYSGNTQARHKNETGVKGCCLVTLHPEAAPEIEFIPVDSVRFAYESLGLSSVGNLEQAIQVIQSRCEAISSSAGERDALIHLTLTGRTEVHEELRQASNVDDLNDRIQSDFEGRTPSTWVHLTVKTQGTYDVEGLKQGNDFIADLLALYDQAEKEEGTEALKQALSPLCEKWAGSKYLEALSQNDIQDLLLQARNLTLDQLVEEK